VYYYDAATGKKRWEDATGSLVAGGSCAEVNELRLENVDLRMRAAQYISHSQFSNLKSPFLRYQLGRRTS
jgi:hypothetical protein